MHLLFCGPMLESELKALCQRLVTIINTLDRIL